MLKVAENTESILMIDDKGRGVENIAMSLWYLTIYLKWYDFLFYSPTQNTLYF